MEKQQYQKLSETYKTSCQNEKVMQFRKSYSVKVWIKRHLSIFLFKLLYFVIFFLILFKIIHFVLSLSVTTRLQMTCFQIQV